MNLLDQAKQIVCGIIAVALAMSVATVEALLPSRPDWLERINELALQLKYRNQGEEPEAPKKSVSTRAASKDSGEKTEIPDMDPEQLLRAYNQLWQFAHAVRSDGLALDEKFCERIEKEWSVSKLLAFMRSADQSLQDRAGTTMDSASKYLAAAAAGNQKSS